MVIAIPSVQTLVSFLFQLVDHSEDISLGHASWMALYFMLTNLSVTSCLSSLNFFAKKKIDLMWKLAVWWKALTQSVMVSCAFEVFINEQNRSLIFYNGQWFIFMTNIISVCKWWTLAYWESSHLPLVFQIHNEETDPPNILCL